jgi:hypothetical protein
MALTCLFTDEQTALNVSDGPLVRKVNMSVDMQSFATEKGRQFIRIFPIRTGDFHQPTTWAREPPMIPTASRDCPPR